MPHSTTNETPSKLFLGHKIRTRLDLILPGHDQTVLDNQANQKSSHDKHSKPRELVLGVAVMARNNQPRIPDVIAKVTKRVGPLTYLVETESGQIWKRHIDHLKSLHHQNVTNDGEDDQLVIVPEGEDTSSTTVSAENANTEPQAATDTESQSATRRYPMRESRHPPSRYGQETEQ